MLRSVRESTAPSEASDHLRVIAPPPLIFALPLAAALFVQRSGSAAWRSVLAALLTLGATLLIASAFICFRRARTTVNPYGRSTAIVESGPYRFTRNPMYVAMTLIYLAAALWLGSWVAVALLPVVLLVVDRGVIRREEIYLSRRFGDEYTRYLRRVRRWI